MLVHNTWVVIFVCEVQNSFAFIDHFETWFWLYVTYKTHLFASLDMPISKALKKRLCVYLLLNLPERRLRNLILAKNFLDKRNLSVCKSSVPHPQADHSGMLDPILIDSVDWSTVPHPRPSRSLRHVGPHSHSLHGLVYSTPPQAKQITQACWTPFSLTPWTGLQYPTPGQADHSGMLDPILIDSVDWSTVPHPRPSRSLRHVGPHSHWLRGLVYSTPPQAKQITQACWTPFSLTPWTGLQYPTPGQADHSGMLDPILIDSVDWSTVPHPSQADHSGMLDPILIDSVDWSTVEITSNN